ncbi:MAG: EAL domain-containing protein, partial [Desulfobulbaceae bacterium]|nr:EAL domain-containing protein [Desulfobulbaceae bacterium]
IKVIVEGIETETQWQTLAPIRLDAVQGFWIGKPEPLIGTRA